MSRPVDERKPINIRMPQELYDKLEKAAKERDLSMNWLIVKALEDFLPRLIPADQFSLTKPESKWKPTYRGSPNEPTYGEINGR